MHDMLIAYDLGNSLLTLDVASHDDYGEAANTAEKWWLDGDVEQLTGSLEKP